MIDLQSALMSYPWAVYALLAAAPFVQEDSAVVGAAAASLHGMVEPYSAAASVLAGLTLSDVWKYWAGRFAAARPWVRHGAQHASILGLKERVLRRLGFSLMVARFVPGTRIPLYVASGVFKAPFAKFAFFVLLSGLAYVGLAFAAILSAGELAGERVQTLAPILVIVVLVSALVVRAGVARLNAR